MQEVYDFLKKSHTYYIATTEGDQPRVRPFGTIDIFEGKLYIQTAKRKDVSKQMHINPKIEICAMNDGKWIRIEAVAVEDSNIAPQEHMLNAYPSLKNIYKPGDGNNEIFYLTEVTAKIFDSPFSDPKIIKF